MIKDGVTFSVDSDSGHSAITISADANEGLDVKLANMTKTIPWDSGGGNITLTYEEGEGNQSISIVSDANSGSERSKTITINAGSVSKTLTINQAMKSIQSGSFVGVPVGYRSDLSNFESINSSYPITRAYTDTSSTTYTTINCSNGSEINSFVYFTFDTSSIPVNATIKSVKCKVKARVSNTNRAGSAYAYLVWRDYFKRGSSVSFRTTSTTASEIVFTINYGGTWTREDIKALYLVFEVTRGTTQVNSLLSMNIYGAELMIDYEY